MKSVAYDAADKWGFPEAGIVCIASAYPDSWTIDIPGWLPSEIRSFIQTCVHSVGHYYNPVIGYGEAPAITASWANDARNRYLQSDTQNAAYSLGYASHFLEDVTTPMHTGGEANQAYDYYNHPAGYPNMHDAYEGYVASNWSSGSCYFLDAYNNWYYVPISNPSQATVGAATFSNQYCGTLIATISNHRDTFSSDPNVQAITHNCITVEDRYMLGLVHYVMYGN